MKRNVTTGITDTSAPATLQAYINRVNDYIQRATGNIADVSDAIIMANDGAVDADTVLRIRETVTSARVYNDALRDALRPLESILSSLNTTPYDTDPRRPVLYKDAVTKAKQAHDAAQRHVRAIEAMRDSARASSGVYGCITSAALEAIAAADNAHSHVLLATQAARLNLLYRHELPVYRPKL